MDNGVGVCMQCMRNQGYMGVRHIHPLVLRQEAGVLISRSVIRQAAALVLSAVALSACFDVDMAGGSTALAQPTGPANAQAADAGEPDEVEVQDGAGQAADASAAEPATDESRVTTSATPSQKTGTITVIDGARTVELPGGETRVGRKRIVDVPPRDEYWLDYTVTFEPGFHFTLAGKLPGLAGGTDTTGCVGTDPAGWSARLGWTLDGVGNLYVYDQHRQRACGNDNYFPQLRYTTGRTHRLTQWVRVNSPGASDGAIQVWLDGRPAVAVDALELRGDVGKSTAMIDSLAYSVFSGGKDPATFAPPSDQAISIGPIHLLTCQPDFSVATPRCAR